MLIFQLTCNQEKEVEFIKNKGNDMLYNVFIRVLPDSITFYESERVSVPGKSQTKLYVNIPNEDYHPGYEFNYSRVRKYSENMSQ